MSLVLLHDRVSMSHEVSFVEWIWAASPAPDVWLQPQPRTRVELNEDRTRTWGGHIAWDRALEQAGWRVGASATVNRKAHPKIPNYSIQNIPRDPGITWAYEAALGVARSLGGTTVGLDIAVQPIWSETWQEADIWTAEASGGRFRVGDRTIENDFFFTNVFMRAGFSHEVEGAAVQVGVEARSYDYSLDQADHLQRSFRRQDESWIEWTPTFGMVFSVSDLELRYSGRVTTGTGRPGVAQERGLFLEAASGGSPGDFILAPGGPLTLQDVRVVTHQLSVRIPVR